MIYKVKSKSDIIKLRLDKHKLSKKNFEVKREWSR